MSGHHHPSTHLGLALGHQRNVQEAWNCFFQQLYPRVHLAVSTATVACTQGIVCLRARSSPVVEKLEEFDDQHTAVAQMIAANNYAALTSQMCNLHGPYCYPVQCPVMI